MIVKKSDYTGEFFYENDTLRFINHGEGRAVMADGVPEYQYHLKDHLGNVRLTFTSKKSTDAYQATMEYAHINDELADFPNYDDVTTSGVSMYNHTVEAGATRSVVLNGAENKQVGLAKSLRVVPGDTVDLEVYAKYFATSSTENIGTFIASAMTSAFGLSSSSIGLEYSAYQSVSGIFNAGWVLDLEDLENVNAPKSFLNYILFDEDFVPYDMGWDQVDSHAAVTASNPNPDHDTLSLQAVARKPGYVYIYFSNEEDEDIIEVYFDDLKITHKHSPVVQADDYYPFGLTFNSYQRENSVEQRWKFQGQEHIDDLGLNWDSFKWRNHQPDIGRFFNIDPLAESYYYNSPYAFSENKVTSHVEIEGLESQSIHLNGEIRKAENVVRSIPDKVEKAVVELGEGIVNIPENIKAKLNGIGAFLESKLGGLSGNRSGSIWTTEENMGNDQSDLPDGEVDGGGNVDGLIGPTLKSSPAKTFMDGFFQGVEMVTTIESKTHVIENVMKETGGNTVELKVESIQDTTMDSQNFMQLKVKTLSGKDSVIQTSKTPDKQDDQKK